MFIIVIYVYKRNLKIWGRFFWECLYRGFAIIIMGEGTMEYIR